jgi:hypothetical protein
MQLTMDVDPNKLEIRQPYNMPLWWTIPPVSINQSIEAVVTNHNVNEIAHLGTCRIYTDSLGINGLIGCTAVSLNLPTVYKAFIGTVIESLIPIAELAGLILAF